MLNVGNGVYLFFAAASAAWTHNVVLTGDSVLSTLVEYANTTLISSDDSTEESNGPNCGPCAPHSAGMSAMYVMTLVMLNWKRNSGGPIQGPLQCTQTFTQIQ